MYNSFCTEVWFFFGSLLFFFVKKQTIPIDALREIARVSAQERTPLVDLFRIHAQKLGLTVSALKHHWERLSKTHNLQIKAHGLQILSAHQIETLRYTCQAFSAANPGRSGGLSLLQAVQLAASRMNAVLFS